MANENRRLIISIGREFGSGGHEIGEILAKRLNLPLYDANILAKIANKSDMEYEDIMKYDEKVVNLFLTRKVRGFSNSLEETIAELQFDYLRKKADAGESFVVVGRCSDEILKDYDGFISIFVYGIEEEKVKRTMNLYKISEAEAKIMNKKVDLKRRLYHNRYCENKWSDMHTYDMCIDSGIFGTEVAADLLEKAILQFQKDRPIKKVSE